MRGLKLLGTVLLVTATLGCEREIEREEGLVESGVTQERPLDRDYCAGLSEGGILDDEREAFDRCRTEGLLDE